MLVDLNTSKIDFRGPLVVLHRPQIPQNTGNIARLCVAIQSPLIITGRAGFDFSERPVRRAGLDHWNHLAFSHFPRFKDFYKKFGEHRLVAVTKAATRSALTFDYTPNGI
ncbi:MAG TPA: TrmH family RNA methyltransferase, partial [Turneriella sp.]|nr:TrmH family RNA methyltransferase [Turneriella sp.]